MIILLTNDDGIQAPGLTALQSACAGLGEIYVVAPDRERSAVSHAFTLHSPLRAEQVADRSFAVDGTPTDCVNLGVHAILPDRPSLIISGINRGGNMGDDLTYSGTVAAAMEGTMMGVPSIAVSLDLLSSAVDDYHHAASVAVRIASMVLQRGLPPDTFLNVNIPPEGTPQRILITRQGRRVYGGMVDCKTDPRGRSYYWLGGGELDFVDEPGTDFHAVKRGFVSVTPLHFDMTNYRSLSLLQGWIEGEKKEDADA